MSSSEATSGVAPQHSALRGWLFLIWLSWQRQARSRQMVWLALALLALAAAFVALQTAGGWWGMSHWRYPYRRGPTLKEWIVSIEATGRAIPYSSPATSVIMAVDAANSAIL